MRLRNIGFAVGLAIAIIAVASAAWRMYIRPADSPYIRADAQFDRILRNARAVLAQR